MPLRIKILNYLFVCSFLFFLKCHFLNFILVLLSHSLSFCFLLYSLICFFLSYSVPPSLLPLFILPFSQFSFSVFLSPLSYSSHLLFPFYHAPTTASVEHINQGLANEVALLPHVDELTLSLVQPVFLLTPLLTRLSIVKAGSRLLMSKPIC